MMEVMIPNRQKAAEFEQTGVPWRNVVAFVGHTPPKDPGLCELIHKKGALCMMGTSRNLDRQFIANPEAGIQALEGEYRAHFQTGVDIFESDIPAPLGAMLFKATPRPPSKQKYFKSFE
jgi:glycerophosphoryl diester phosphodiesterase